MLLIQNIRHLSIAKNAFDCGLSSDKNTYNKGYLNECLTGNNRVCEVEHSTNRVEDSAVDAGLIRRNILARSELTSTAIATANPFHIPLSSSSLARLSIVSSYIQIHLGLIRILLAVVPPAMNE